MEVSALRGVFNPSVVGGRVLYGLLSFPIGLTWFIVFMTALSISAGLLVVMVGVVFLSITLRMARWAANIDRRLIAQLLDDHIETPERVVSGDRSVVNAVLDPLRDGTYWRELFFVLLRFPLGLLGFVVTILAVAFPLYAFSTLFWGWFVFGAWTLMFLIFGVLSFVAGPAAIAASAELNVAIARVLLGPSRSHLSARARSFEQSRDRSVHVADAERRRIERDLHDGAQARLATVALDLGRAKRRLEQGGSSDEVGRIIESAHSDAKAAIVELRDLARGIHPAVLTDRGLDAALSEVVARSPTPVHLDVRMQKRPSAPVESAAYFAVCELINNIGRHASARNVWITVRGTHDELIVDVSDDGVGGVDPSLGTGIAGLHDRLSAVEGSLSINSPLGGGTSATIELPVG